MVQVTIVRLGGEPPLVIDNADWLAEAFFAVDPSGKPGGFDDKAAESVSTRIESKDVDAINGTMRARSPQRAWATVKDQELPWLAAVTPTWDLVELDDAEWGDHAAPALEAALDALIQKGRGVSVSTKMLHLKRPKLVPVLDSLASGRAARRRDAVDACKGSRPDRSSEGGGQAEPRDPRSDHRLPRSTGSGPVGRPSVGRAAVGQPQGFVGRPVGARDRALAPGGTAVSEIRWLYAAGSRTRRRNDRKADRHEL